MSKLNPNDFDYLSLEGGGGKGIVYLGAVKALEEVYLPIIKQALAATEETLTPFGTAFQTKSTYPLFPIWDLLPKDRPFKGISGSSAGAITAFMLAMGMTSDEIVEESKKTAFIMLEGEKEKVSQFETFYSPPDVVNFRSVEHEGSEVVVKKRKFDNSLGMITGSAFKAFIAGIYNLLSPIMTLNTTLKKVLFGAQTGVKKGVNPKTDTPYRSSMPGYSGIVFSRYMESLLNNFGLFSGLAVRTYFTSLIQRQLIDKQKD